MREPKKWVTLRRVRPTRYNKYSPWIVPGNGRGIYHLFYSNGVTYIGKSSKTRVRLAAHDRQAARRKIASIKRVRYLPVTEWNMSEVEAYVFLYNKYYKNLNMCNEYQFESYEEEFFDLMEAMADQAK